MHRRGRKPAPRSGGPGRAVGIAREKPRRQPSRSEARNAAARAKLKPLADGERPLAVTIAALAALAVSIANLVAYAAGLKIQGHRPAAAGIAAFTLLTLAMAAGMWRRRYWAVLGMQALLAIVILVFGVLLVIASNLQAAGECVAALVVCGTLFWFLVKAMARIQMTQGPS